MSIPNAESLEDHFIAIEEVLAVVAALVTEFLHDSQASRDDLAAKAVIAFAKFNIPEIWAHVLAHVTAAIVGGKTAVDDVLGDLDKLGLANKTILRGVVSALLPIIQQAIKDFLSGK